jgi:hypothetical protein
MSIAYERVDEFGRDEEYSLAPSPPELTRNVRAFNDRWTSSEQDQPAASILTGSGLDGEPQVDPELTSIRAMSIDSLQCTFSDAPSSVNSIHCNERPGEIDQPTFPRCSNDCTLASKSQGSTESYAWRRLPSRTTIQRDFFWCLAWFFDIVLTIIPLLFLGRIVAIFFLLFCANPY